MTTRTNYSREITPKLGGKNVTVCGWVQDTRVLGNLIFINIRDRYGFAQATLAKKTITPELFSIARNLGKEDVIAVSGKVKPSEQAPNGAEIIPEKIELLSKAGVPLPLDVSGKIESELDTRLNARFMDLRIPRNRAIFVIRSHLVNSLHEAMDKEGFIQVQTPKIVKAGAESGATLFKINFFGQEAFLSQSPQLYKQTLMAAGLERVYEFGPLFRAEASDTIRHLSEFYGFDAEMSFINSEEDVMQALEKAISFAFSEVRKRAKEELELLRVEVRVPKTPFPRIRVEDAGTMLEKVNGKLTPEGDMDTENEKLFGKLMSESGQELYFLTRYPTSVRPFYLMRAENPFETRSFDLEFKGMEMASGGQREHRYDALIKSLHEKGLRPEAFNHYLEAFRYGMPPHGGFGLGIDRLVQQMLNLPNVRETILFPRDRSRMAP